MHRINVYIPATHLEQVKLAMFEAGAGRIGNYDRCCWQIAGQGQFRPLEGNNAFIGETGQLELVEEYKVEMVVADEHVNAVIAAMQQAHPFEEPAYDVYKPVDLPIAIVS
ncbi:NGG1p interacting factor NIF3 [Bermanella marisrubri]|uniref:NGG1p interacting factor NIF3 n=1 Tax=Bermanella marisrubri TaxID=207949 RepID=Q1N015_9GAMM|nr:YqfO family protein [Bermanella marisrubri]EAT11548.1 hypothetical protein RED65_02719 [Oceanobacter sp. RED65] [Bermanella marisrubri]QIZ84987.1 NGG1p interacting factor NIF3 [Bermanella marisrubri]